LNHLDGGDAADKEGRVFTLSIFFRVCLSSSWAVGCVCQTPIQPGLGGDHIQWWHL